MPHAQPDGYLAVPTSGHLTRSEESATGSPGGFVAFAPDLYQGKVAGDIADAEALVEALDADRAEADLADATAFLRPRLTLEQRKNVTRLA